MEIRRCKECGIQARHTGFKYGMNICAKCYFKIKEQEKQNG